MKPTKKPPDSDDFFIAYLFDTENFIDNLSRRHLYLYLFANLVSQKSLTEW